MSVMKIVSYLVLAVSVGACGSGRPDGEAVDGLVLITASASVAGVLLPADGVTSGATVVIDGSMIDRFGVATSSYSWAGGPFVDLPLGETGSFQLSLTMVEDENTLVFQATSSVGDDVSELSLSYYRDVTPPVIEAPSLEFAASIIGEGEMEIEKNSTSLTLTSGTAVAVRDGVSFSKYSSRYGVDQPNRPVWRFNLTDDYGIEGARMEFRILKKGAEESDVDEEMVDWTTAELGEESDFELTVSSTLNERIGSESGVFFLEVRAFDGAGIESGVTRLQWTQAILNPPIFIATGNETIMGTPGGPTDPRSYVIGSNFSGITSQQGLAIGSLRIGNPNDVPVLVGIESILDPRSSYSHRRSFTAVQLDLGGPSGQPCGTGNTLAEEVGCLGNPSEWTAPRTRALSQEDVPNRHLSFEIRTVGGDVVSNSNSFIIPGNTEFVAIATLAVPLGNVLGSLEDSAQLGPFKQNITHRNLDLFWNCSVTTSGGSLCSQWDLARDYRELLQFYASWEFTARVESKVNLDINDATPWSAADPNVVPGYSRVLATGAPGQPVPTSLADINTGF